jgi:hypothetical protein
MSELRREPTVRFATWATYGLAALFFIHPVADLLTNFIPIEFGNVQWRYAFVGLLSNYVLTMLAGIVFAAVAAAISRQNRALQWVAGVAAVVALVLAITTIVFILDVLQLRVSVPPEEKLLFKIGSLKAVAKLAVAVLYVGAVAIAGWLVTGRTRRTSRQTPPLLR